jgi:hypothetical protein
MPQKINGWLIFGGYLRLPVGQGEVRRWLFLSNTSQAFSFPEQNRRVDKRSASTFCGHDGGCAALIHPTQEQCRGFVKPVWFRLVRLGACKWCVFGLQMLAVKPHLGNG